MDNDEQQMMLVHGYIRQCWNLKKFDGIVFLCDDIIDLIFGWSANEMVYLLKNHKEECKALWRISLTKILQQ